MTMTREVPKTFWKPRRKGKNGEIFCSPGCGGDCTRKDWELAHKRAKALAKRLGKGWKPRVWENGAWHYSVVSPCDRLNVYPKKYGSYSAYLNKAGSGGGRWVGHGTTPRKAIKDAVRQGMEAKAELDAIMDGLE
jgi:hypothetical protein